VVTVSLTSSATIIDTETRHLAPQQAADRIRVALNGRTADLIYKKTDSTLRGNIGAELQTIGECFPDRPIIYIPAYPAAGRTSRNGHLYVHGEPLHTTAFARDPLNPITSSRIADALSGCSLPVTIVDAQTDEQVAAAIPKPPAIIAGPANLAACLTRCTAANPGSFRIGRCLVINGSLHPLSAEQFERGRDQHWLEWTFANEWVPGDYDTLVVFGGDTAFGILQTLKVTELVSAGELMPAVPLSRIGSLNFITKAGGLGPVDVLQRIKSCDSE
jgi:uncharacterized protein YgbK (DUF1537 family)